MTDSVYLTRVGSVSSPSGGLLAIYAGDNPYYISVICDVARRAARAGQFLTFLDLSPTLGVRFHPSAATVIGRARGHYLQGPPSRSSLGTTVLPGELREILREVLERAVRSSLITEFRDESPEGDPRWETRRRQALDRAYRTAEVVYACIRDLTPVEVVIANGRFPYQAAANLVARHAGCRVRFFEQGETGENSYFLEEFRTLDYLRSQHALLESVRGGISEREEDDAAEWFRSRSNGVGHIFGRAWDLDRPTTERLSGPTVTVFTTSEDEYAELDDEWKPHSWSSQWAAIRHVCNLMHELGWNIVVRVHPNLAGKSRRAYKRTMSEQSALLRDYPQVRLVRHDSQESSYNLIMISDLVVVWNSTVGLEAVAAGKPVYCLTAAYYDQVCTVRSWYGPHEDPKVFFRASEVDPLSAIRFRAAMVARDHHFLGDTAVDYLYLQKCGGSTLRRSLGLGQTFIAPALWFDLLRNRRISANGRILLAHARRVLGYRV